MRTPTRALVFPSDAKARELRQMFLSAQVAMDSFRVADRELAEEFARLNPGREPLTEEEDAEFDRWVNLHIFGWSGLEDQLRGDIYELVPSVAEA